MSPIRRLIQQGFLSNLTKDPEVNTTYSTADTALLLVDLLNDFLDEKGKLSQRIGPMLKKTDLIAHLQRLVKGARAAGVKIIYVPHGLHEPASTMRNTSTRDGSGP